MISGIIFFLGLAMIGLVGSVFIMAVKGLDEIDEIGSYSSTETNRLPDAAGFR